MIRGQSILIRVIWIWLFTICASPAWGQTYVEDKQSSQKSFTQNDGLEVGNITNLEFDNEGWLWLLGFESELGLSTFLENKVILQRFDGFTFKTIALPKVEGEVIESARLYKRADGLFYLKLSSGTVDYLFLLDPNTFEFEKISLSNLRQRGEIVGFFPEEEATYFAMEIGVNSYLFELKHDLSIKQLFRLNSEPQGGSAYLNLLKFHDHFLITDQHTGITLYAFDGTREKVFGWPDFPSAQGEGKPVLLAPQLIDNAYHFRLDNEPFLFIYHPETKSWSRSEISMELASSRLDYNPVLRMESLSDDAGNAVRMDLNKDQFIILRFLSGSSEKVRKSYIDIPEVHAVGSRDIGKEVFIASPGKLHRVTFKQLNVVTFLDNMSVRSIEHWQGSQYIVGAESSGFFLIDIEAQTTRKLFGPSHDNRVIASEIRGIYKNGDVIWSNYNGGIIRINSKTKEVRRYRHYPIWTMIEEGKAIYYGSHDYPLMVFDKTTGLNTQLSQADSLSALDIEIFEGKIFMTTTEGLFTYENGTERFHDIDVAPGQLMMLDLNEKQGLLISTRQGEVFAMKHKDDQPKLLYQDPQQKPIASILTDVDDNLWLNTFQGILKINTSTGEMLRFLQEDGLSHNEMNRYSQYVTNSGSFLVGSVRGLNYFDPKTIKKVKKTGGIAFTGLSLYDTRLNENIELVSPEALRGISKVLLPAENRYTKINVAPVGLVETPEIQMQYRLNGSEWQDLKDRGTIELLNIAPGSYRLESRLVDSEGATFGDTFSLEIKAGQLFYKTAWFIVLCFLLIVAISAYLILQARRAGLLQQRFTQSLIKAQEDERIRISRDLHDSVGQQLILLKNQAGSLKSEVMINTASATLEEVRSITRDLHPAILDRLGLTAALEEMIHKLDENTDIFFSADFDNIDDVFLKDKELNLYRIIQESLNNIVKHSQAMSAKLSIEKFKSKVVLKIEDNGIGFDVSRKKSQSLGLKTIQERASMLRAKISVNSSETGSKISLEIPR